MLPAHPAGTNGPGDLSSLPLGPTQGTSAELDWSFTRLPWSSKGEIQFREKASCQVLTSGFTVLEGSGSQVFGEEASSTGKAGSTASFRLECAQGTELAGCKAIRGIFTRLAQTWGDQ